MDQRYGTKVWSRGMERILQTGMERRYGTGVWNGCGPGPCSGPCILTCTQMWMTQSLRPQQAMIAQTHRFLAT